MSSMLFQSTDGQADVHGRERLGFFNLCNQTARRAGVTLGPFTNPGQVFNACIATRDDAVILATRIHGQSEDILFVEGKNRAWLADIIESGCARDVLHTEMGWGEVVALLRASNFEAVVITTSQGESFPNMGIAIEHKTWSPSDPDDEDGVGEEWYDAVTDADKWTHGLAALRAREQTTDFGWELKPDNWTTYRFATD